MQKNFWQNKFSEKTPYFPLASFTQCSEQKLDVLSENSRPQCRHSLNE
jgi:hypothetical protein